MSTRQHTPAAPTWTIRSVSVRTRDGPERLDQVYRRLLSNTPFRPSAGPDDASTKLIADPAPDLKR
jgi:hypothetical protein